MGYREYRTVILKGNIPKEHVEPMRKLAIFASPEWKEKPIFNLFISFDYMSTSWIQEEVHHSTGVGKVFEGEEGVEEIKKELKEIVKEFPGTIFHIEVSDEDHEKYPYSFTVQ